MADFMISEVGSTLPRKRRVASCILSFALPETEFLESYPVADPSTEVRCLSQTFRTLSDDGIGDREALTANKATGVQWEHVTLSNEKMSRHQLHGAKTVLCVEAFKLMEADFTVIMKSLAGMRSYEQTVEGLQVLVEREAKRFSVRVNPKDWWYESVPFGVFCSAVTRLILLDGIDNEKARVKVRSMIENGLDLAKEVLAEGVDLLEKGSGALLKDQTFMDNLEFMRDEANIIQVVREFACIAGKKAERNSISHPFGNLNTAGEKIACIDAYSAILNEVYADSFRNVGVLCLLRLQIENEKTLKQDRKILEEMDEELRRLVMEDIDN